MIKKHIKRIILLYVLSSISSNLLAQEKEKSLFAQRLNFNNIATITIIGGCERGHTSEIDVVYLVHLDSNKVGIRIHSIIRDYSNNITDTTFLLSITQENFINQFEGIVQKQKVQPYKTVFAGCYTKFTIDIDNKSEETEAKFEYSLLERLKSFNK